MYWLKAKFQTSFDTSRSSFLPLASTAQIRSIRASIPASVRACGAVRWNRSAPVSFTSAAAASGGAPWLTVTDRIAFVPVNGTVVTSCGEPGV